MTIIEELRKQIADLQARIDAIQAACSHPYQAVESKNGASTGGYDGPASDQFWTDHWCRLCDKRWREERNP